MTSPEGSSASVPLVPETEEQKSLIKAQRGAAVLRMLQGPRPFVTGALLFSMGTYVFQYIYGEFTGGDTVLRGVSMNGLVSLAAFLGSIVYGGAVNLAGIIRHDPLLQHYLSLLEVWLKYKQGRMSPSQYYEHGALLDYQRLYGHLTPDARPKKTAYVREVLHWKELEIKKAIEARNQKAQKKPMA